MGRGLVIAYLSTAVATMVGVWWGLPDRWWPIDLLGTLVSALLALAAVGMLSSATRGRQLARVCAWSILVIGMALTTLLVWTAAHLAGLYGPVGGGGALLLAVVALLIVPYFVGLPWLGILRIRRMAPGESS